MSIVEQRAKTAVHAARDSVLVDRGPIVPLVRHIQHRWRQAVQERVEREVKPLLRLEPLLKRTRQRGLTGTGAALDHNETNVLHES